MLLCHCNAIREKHVEQALASPPKKVTPAQIYTASATVAGALNCAPQCGKCMCEFKDIAAKHNADKALDKLKKTVEIMPSVDKISA